MRDPRHNFFDIVRPVVRDVLSQWTPPLKRQHFEQLGREVSDELFGLGIAVVRVGDDLLVDESGDAIHCEEVSRGGTGPYGITLKFQVVKMET